MKVWYNEFDPFAASWLERLIAHGLLPHGFVDRRSIVDVEPRDLIGYDQLHFFAGIGGWPLALRMAGWDDCMPVVTASLPCQPFSAAGKRSGFADERHLWPVFFEFVKKRGFERILGEQVSSKDGLQWFDTVQADLESQNYAVAAFDLCAAGVQAQHLRQRLFFVADAQSSIRGLSVRQEQGKDFQSEWGGEVGSLGNADGGGDCGIRSGEAPAAPGGDEGEIWQQRSISSACGNGDANILVHPESEQMGLPRRTWLRRDAVFCRDRKWRSVEPGTSPLVTTIPDRVGMLRGYGNAIYVPLAVEFIKSYMDLQ